MSHNPFPFPVPDDTAAALGSCRRLLLADGIEDLTALACRDAVGGWHDVSYDVPGRGSVLEARVCRVKNGIAANYPEPYMRRRDPDCMLIGDDLPTDKPRFSDRYGRSFASTRTQALEWLATQELAAFAFCAGGPEARLDALAIVPANAGFFALGLALLQGVIPARDLRPDFAPRTILCCVPPFRHSHFDGRQVVVHSRSSDLHEVWSFNLYPGPSAKKAVFSALIDHGEREGWVTAHCSTVEVVTPYDNRTTIMHEGASGGGKSEMLEHVHREEDGRLLVGTNLVSGERQHLIMPRGCALRPVNDDMALCAPSLQKPNGKLAVIDAEAGWFIRVNHILGYGTDPDIESMTIRPKLPLLFLNIDAQPGSTALVWEHTEDAPGKACPNPRIVIPRSIVPGSVGRPASVDIRSFGVRTPPCTRERPSYGILGLFHVLPPALAWIWRLVSPRGHDNPSITDSGDMASDGVGSYWPFATGRRIPQANLLLRQVVSTPRTQYVLCPNQHVGAWKVGFMPQWIMREYVARRGGVQFRSDQIKPARCPLLGYSIRHIVVEGVAFEEQFFSIDKQAEVGPEAYAAGARELAGFFRRELTQYLGADLDPLGKQIIDCCLSGGSPDDYVALVEGTPVLVDD